VVTKLEFVPVPDPLTEPCLAPLPPLTDDGNFFFHKLPGYTISVLGALEECNLRMQKLRELNGQ
jgi:hypothetical protein